METGDDGTRERVIQLRTEGHSMGTGKERMTSGASRAARDGEPSGILIFEESDFFTARTDPPGPTVRTRARDGMTAHATHADPPTHCDPPGDGAGDLHVPPSPRLS